MFHTPAPAEIDMFFGQKHDRIINIKSGRNIFSLLFDTFVSSKKKFYNSKDEIR